MGTKRKLEEGSTEDTRQTKKARLGIEAFLPSCLRRSKRQIRNADQEFDRQLNLRLEHRRKNVLKHPYFKPTDSLKLYLCPRSSRILQYPDFDGLPSVPLHFNQFFRARINGRYAEVCVNTESPNSYISYSKARELSLLEKMESYEEVIVSSYRETHKPSTTKFGFVPNVLMDIEGDIKFYVHMYVTPEDFWRFKQPITLGVNDLQRLGAIEEFKDNQAFLHFKKPQLFNKRLKRDVKKTAQKFALNVHLKRSRKDRIKSMLVDTGFEYNFVTEKVCQEASVTPMPYSTQYWYKEREKIQKVKLHFSWPSDIKTDFIVHRGDIIGFDYDFVLGRDFLSQHNSALDFSSRIMYTCTGTRNWRKHRLTLRKPAWVKV